MKKQAYHHWERLINWLLWVWSVSTKTPLVKGFVDQNHIFSKGRRGNTFLHLYWASKIEYLTFYGPLVVLLGNLDKLTFDRLLTFKSLRCRWLIEGNWKGYVYLIWWSDFSYTNYCVDKCSQSNYFS